MTSLNSTPREASANEEAEPGGMAQPIRYASDQWAVVPKWHASPTIDGRIDEWMWGTAAKLGQFRTAYYEHSLGNTVEYRLAYDAGNLYIGGKIGREEADTLSHIEVLLRPVAGEERFYTIRIPLDSARAPTLNMVWNPSPDGAQLSADDGKQIVSAFSHAYDVQPEALYVEAAVPLASIVPQGVSVGDEWGLNIVHVHNLYTQPLSSWAPIRNSDHWHQNGPDARVRVSLVDQDRFGSILFSSLPQVIAGNGGLAVPLRPEEPDVQLLYTGFTEKRLRVHSLGEGVWSQLGQQALNASSAELLWRVPGQTWQSLGSGLAWNDRDGVLELDFEHPAPKANGIYQLRVVLSHPHSSLKGVATLSIDREAMIAAGEAAQSASQSPGEPAVTVGWSEPSAEVTRIMGLIPPQPGFLFVGLPEAPELYPGGLYQLSADGHSLIASRTGTVYPNEQYPENKSLVVTNGKGETVSIPYHEDDAGNRYFLSAHLWFLQKSRAVSQTGTLAKTDPLGGARLLYAFAQAYEGYNPTVDRVAGNLHANLSADRRSGPPYAYWGGIWDRWWYNDLPQMAALIRAYADLKRTNAFELLSAEAGEDVEARIVQGMILPSMDFVLTYPDYLGNMSFRPWKGLVDIGKALEMPELIHRVVELVGRMAEEMFLSDGYWQEASQSYHLQTANEMKQVADQLRGWSDPAGYVSPRTGIRFDDLDLNEMYPILQRAIDAGNKLVYPDGKVLPITDTWANQKPPAPQPDTGSMLLPAAKIGRLAGGAGANQTQLNMAFQPKYGHLHYDPLNLTLYAQGQELLPDLGYTHNTFYRWFSLSTMSHNTVVVDGKNMVNGAEARQGGAVEAFVPQGGLFQAMRASYESAYPETETYSREPWFVPFAGGAGAEGYVLDLFRVAGGSRHEYTFQGDANRDARFETNAPLIDYGPYLLPPGTEVRLPTNNNDSGSAEGHYPGYIYVRDVQKAELNGERYDVTLVTESGGAEQAKLKVTGLLDPGNNELYLGRSPSLRSIRLQGNSMDNNDEAVKYSMPKLVQRREGTDLRSTFVTVMEPYRGPESRLEAIDRLQPDQAPEGAVAVQVAYGDTTDIILSNPHHPQTPVTIGDLTLIGEMGLVRLVNGVVEEMELVGGTLLRKDGQSITGSGHFTGTVTGTLSRMRGDDRDALVVNGAVPAAAAGRYGVVRHPNGNTSGFKIADVRVENGQSVVVLAEHDPGFELLADGASRQSYYPGAVWTAGAHTLMIADVVRAEVQGDAPAMNASVTGVVYLGNGQPAARADVRLTGYSAIRTVADEHGVFELPQVLSGQLRVTASRSDYAKAVSDAVYAAPGQTAHITLALTRELPPVLYNATPIGALAGEQVRATSTGYGYVHLVPANTPSDKSSIEAVTAQVYGARMRAEPGLPVLLETGGRSEGKYMLYAISDIGLVSGGHPLVILSSGPGSIQDTSPLITYTGRWEAVSGGSYSGGTLTLGREKGAYMEVPFYGSSAKMFADLHTARGKGKVYVDGEYAATIDFYSSPIRYRQEVFDTGPLEEGIHTIGLEALWEKDESSTGFNVS
ncbi:MAG: Heparinase II/III-like protein, partial [Paenibacillus sp.]|nr:Heparinase II/III-like protein [Paenibacillus sp.]